MREIMDFPYAFSVDLDSGCQSKNLRLFLYALCVFA